ncbi:MAG: RNA polymerase sigma factor region1.1 domain-containing protein, partial [Paracoccaceae bacterium]
MAAKANEQKTGEDQQDNPGPMLDMSQAAVKKMIVRATARGYITYDELNQFMPDGQVSSDQIEDIMAMLSDMGVNIIEGEEAEDEDTDTDVEEIGATTSRELVAAAATTETLDRTDDPVRMYLREMGTVELLSREGEIAIAKRIEAGRSTMITGLCESPLTFHAITIWREELLEEEIMLRDVIDLDATFGQQMEEEEEVSGATKTETAAVEKKEKEQILEADENADTQDEDDDDQEEEEAASLSLAAMEAILKPIVLETLDQIAADYERLAEMQEGRMAAALNTDETFTITQEREYQRLRTTIVTRVNSMHLHNNRIEALVDQLYGINRKIMSLDSAMVKLSDQAHINRREFIDEYKGAELDPDWMQRVSALGTRGWDILTGDMKDKVEDV